MKISAEVRGDDFRLDVEPAEILKLTCGDLTMHVSANYDGSVDVSCPPKAAKVRCEQQEGYQQWRFSREKPPKKARRK